MHTQSLILFIIDLFIAYQDKICGLKFVYSDERKSSDEFPQSRIWKTVRKMGAAHKIIMDTHASLYLSQGKDYGKFAMGLGKLCMCTTQMNWICVDEFSYSSNTLVLCAARLGIMHQVNDSLSRPILRKLLTQSSFTR